MTKQHPGRPSSKTSEFSDRTHVVVAVVFHGDGSDPYVHVYGPYTKRQADLEQRDMQKEYEGQPMLITAKAIIDIDAANARLQAQSA